MPLIGLVHSRVLLYGRCRVAMQVETATYSKMYRDWFSGGRNIRPYPPDPSTGLLGNTCHSCSCSLMLCGVSSVLAADLSLLSVICLVPEDESGTVHSLAAGLLQVVACHEMRSSDVHLDLYGFNWNAKHWETHLVSSSSLYKFLFKPFDCKVGTY